MSNMPDSLTEQGAIRSKHPVTLDRYRLAHHACYRHLTNEEENQACNPRLVFDFLAQIGYHQHI